MAQELKALRFDPDAVPPSWEFQLIEDGVPGAVYRTMRPGEDGNPSKISLPDPETPSTIHVLVLVRSAP